MQMFSRVKVRGATSEPGTATINYRINKKNLVHIISLIYQLAFMTFD